MAKRKDLLTVPMTIEWDRKSNRKYFLEYLINKNKYSTMIEVGVRDGRTTFYLLDHCPELTIYGVDLSIAGFYSQGIKEQYGNRLIPIQGNSSLVTDQMPNADLIFIDGDHSYNGCRADIMAYRHKLNKGGLLCGHDIDFPGVNQAVKELIINYDVGPNNVWLTKPLDV
jgi:predicted O-methyltransferase YrrM